MRSSTAYTALWPTLTSDAELENLASSSNGVLEELLYPASQLIIRKAPPQVTSAFFGSDFVTVSKTEDCPWAVLKPDVFAAIMDHFSSGEPLFTDASAAASDTAINDDDTEVS